MAKSYPTNLLCYGDNLAFLKQFDDESVDLIYLDPPFNSQQSYNVLFKEATGAPEAAQIKAFEDTWTWDLAANQALTEIHTDPGVPAPLVELMKTFMHFLKASPMMAYLVQMAVRLVQMHRVLKPTGSLYLHCDPTASHYLKLVLDSIFGPMKFHNEIVWKRSASHGGGNCLNRIHDVIFFYAKGGRETWNPQYLPLDEEYVRTHYTNVEPDDRKYQLISLSGAGQGPPRIFNGKEIAPPKGRHWAYTQEKIDELIANGYIVFTKSGMPRLKRYLDEGSGMPLTDLWADIPPINSQAAERMGYPTQKPIEMLKRIIRLSSNPGDVILDPFCGCGTTIDAAETLNRENPDKPPRRWIGIDITHIAIGLIKHRLATRFKPPPEFEVQGEPASAAGAAALAAQDPFDFQYWALGLVGARPIGGKPKKGADKGIDGVRYFQDEQKGGAWLTKKMLVQVKSGHVKAADLRDFVGTLSRERAEMGVFLTLESPSQPMRTEAASAGTYTSPWDKQAYPKVQILTIEELLRDPHRPNPRCLQIPGGAGGPGVTLPEAPKHRRKGVIEKDLDLQGRHDE